ncbi:MAG: PilZ domain-containing protein [Caulobacterales bacterium]
MPAQATFEDVVTQLSSARRLSPSERRRFRRVPLAVRGRLMDSTGREYDCRTADVSPGDARIFATADVKVGDKIVFYLDELGRLEGHVVRCGENGEFAIVLSATQHKREKLAELLTYLMSKDKLGEETSRPRAQQGGGALTAITIENAPVIEGEILDFSLVGMAIRTKSARPDIGTWVRVGGLDGRIARYIDGGFAIDFEIRNKTI